MFGFLQETNLKHENSLEALLIVHVPVSPQTKNNNKKIVQDEGNLEKRKMAATVMTRMTQ